MRNLKQALTRRIVASLPRVFSLLDKNPLSASFGCLDRRYWQYKIIDFPSGMQQELARVLAWAATAPDSPYRDLPRVRDYARGAIRYHARISHADGSLDDYFPCERALGATGYATAALADSCRRLGWVPDHETAAALRRSGVFLDRHTESGLLANHHAIALYALTALAGVLNEPALLASAGRKAADLAAMQHPEGWFPEYEGCDLGYQTVTLEFLARTWKIAPDLVPVDMLRCLVGFLRHFAHPDGSFGGEYGSRNTYNFYPGGFALCAETVPEAREMLALYALSLDRHTENHLADDGVFGHMLSTWITAVETLEEGQTTLQPPVDRPGPGLRLWPGAALFTGSTERLFMVGNLSKGGCYKIFVDGALLFSDTGFAGSTGTGIRFCQNSPGSSQAVQEGETITITGSMRRYKEKRLTQVAMIGLRGLALVFGRLPGFSRTIRIMMQKTLIFDKKALPIAFKRTITVTGNAITVTDRLRCMQGVTIQTLYRTTDCVNLHVVTSDSFQEANLLPWERISPQEACSGELSKVFAPSAAGEKGVGNSRIQDPKEYKA